MKEKNHMIISVDAKKKKKKQGAWVAQSLKSPTFDFGSGHGIMDVRLSPTSNSVLSRESARDSLSLYPSLWLCSYSLHSNK